MGNPRSLIMAKGASLAKGARLSKGSVFVLLLLAIAIAVLVTALGSHGTSTPVRPLHPTAAPTAVPPSIYVHLLGAVVHPGLYQLPVDSRAVDAVAAAGGFLGDADRAALNLARFLSDGEQVYVPVVGELPQDSPLSAGAVGGKVNLNTADSATLETLPRVGPAMAARIIAWRDANGRFAAVEDLKSVSGIGDKTFEAMRDLVTV
jgi:competence protein ComEA